MSCVLRIAFLQCSVDEEGNMLTGPLCSIVDVSDDREGGWMTAGMAAFGDHGANVGVAAAICSNLPGSMVGRTSGGL